MAPNGSSLIRLVDVRKSFRGGRDQVLKGVSLEFAKGELTYILGSSGAGKSVMLKHILGLLKPDSGEVWVDGQEMSTLSGDDLSNHRKVFGMLFQNSALFDDMTIFENVAFPLREHSQMTEAQITEKVETTLSILGLVRGTDSNSYEKFPNELSGGMRKRVGLARAIIREPKILLYDEPTTGLDPLTRTTVDDLIAELKSRLRLTSIVISHDIPSALLLADKIAFLDKGEIVFFGTPEQFRETRQETIMKFLKAEQRTIEALMA